MLNLFPLKFLNLKQFKPVAPINPTTKKQKKKPTKNKHKKHTKKIAIKENKYFGYYLTYINTDFILLPPYYFKGMQC